MLCLQEGERGILWDGSTASPWKHLGANILGSAAIMAWSVHLTCIQKLNYFTSFRAFLKCKISIYDWDKNNTSMW